jgi:hypothetical protein
MIKRQRGLRVAQRDRPNGGRQKPGNQPKMSDRGRHPNLDISVLPTSALGESGPNRIDPSWQRFILSDERGHRLPRRRLQFATYVGLDGEKGA